MTLPESSNQLSPGLALTILTFLGAIVTGILYVIRANRLLFNCLLIATALHVAIVGAFWLVSNVTKAHDDLIKFNVSFVPPKPEEPKKIEKVPEKIEETYKNFGHIDSQEKNVKEIAKGERDTEYKPNQNQPAGGQGSNALVSEEIFTGEGIISNFDSKYDNIGGSRGTGINTSDVKNIGNGDGEGGYGDPNGTAGGGIPPGFNDGKMNGRLYFMRVRHTGSWNSYSNGIGNLLRFMNTSGLSAANGDTPMNLKDIDSNYLSKGGVPSFLYFYCDASFSLTANDVDILKRYIDKGGFLFLDSRPDSSVERVVKNQMSKVFPSSGMSNISKGHAINTYQYTLEYPGIGLNLTSNAANMGIQKGGRYVVFYTKGNFAQLYSENQPSTQEEYFKAQYQMGANVVLYAVNKGRAGAVEKRKGASARIDEAAETAIMKMLGGGIGVSSTKPTEAPTSLKTTKPTDPEKTDDKKEVNLFDDETPDMLDIPGFK